MLGNFARQRFPGKRLIIVENGPAIGSVPRPMDCDILSSPTHIAHAKNAALDFIKKQGGGFFATMDDDDWYGPGYLDELAGYARSFDGLGKQRHFVSLGDDLREPAPELFLTNRIHQDLVPASWLSGGTISGWAETALPFRAVQTEDLDWCSRMQAQGARLRGLSIYHYLYRRSYAGAAHTWAQSRERFRDSLKNKDTLEFPLTEAGNIDFDIVTGEKAPTKYRVVGQKRFIPTTQTHP